MTDMNGQKRCGGCSTERGKGEECPTCGLVNDPIPMTAKQAWVIRRKWDASEERYQQIMDRAAARQTEIGPESYTAELDRDLAMLFPRRGAE